jgi:hypothetical protein
MAASLPAALAKHEQGRRAGGRRRDPGNSGNGFGGLFFEARCFLSRQLSPRMAPVLRPSRALALLALTIVKYLEPVNATAWPICSILYVSRDFFALPAGTAAAGRGFGVVPGWLPVFG